MNFASQQLDELHERRVRYQRYRTSANFLSRHISDSPLSVNEAFREEMEPFVLYEKREKADGIEPDYLARRCCNVETNYANTLTDCVKFREGYIGQKLFSVKNDTTLSRG